MAFLNNSRLALVLGAASTASWAAPAGGGVRAIVDVESGYVLGASLGSGSAVRWLKPAEAARTMRGGERYRVYDSRRLLGASTGTRPKSEGAPCDETLFAKVTPNFGAGQIAVGGAWNAMPRPVRVMSTTQPAYIQAVASLLRANGIARPQVKMQQVWRADLDGDGEPEVLISATNHARYPGGGLRADSRAGEYSLLLLRQTVRGRAVTRVLNASYYPKAKEFNAPSVSNLAAVLDLNGDGKMEVVMRSRYYEGVSTVVFEMQRGKPVPVLNEGCGA